MWALWSRGLSCGCGCGCTGYGNDGLQRWGQHFEASMLKKLLKEIGRGLRVRDVGFNALLAG